MTSKHLDTGQKIHLLFNHVKYRYIPTILQWSFIPLSVEHNVYDNFIDRNPPLIKSTILL